MVELFKDLPEAVASTVEIAERCAFRPKTHKPILPRFSVGADGHAVDEAAELRQQAEEGLARRMQPMASPRATPKRNTASAWNSSSASSSA